MKSLLTLLLFGSLNLCSAQMLHHLPAQPYAAAIAYSRLQADAFSFDKNPALLANLKKTNAGFYAGQRFMLQELTYGAAAIAVPAGSSRLGLVLQHEGGSQQHRSSAGISFAQTLGTKAGLGIVCYYQSVAAAGYGATAMIGVGLGGTLQITSNLQGGCSIFKHAGNSGKYAEERFAGLYQFSLGYDFSDELCISSALEKREGMPPEVQAAISYRFSQKLSSRMGVHSGTGLYFIGGGFRAGVLQMHVFGSMHPKLGFSPGLQVLFSPKEKE